jgi:hypothetical protein
LVNQALAWRKSMKYMSVWSIKPENIGAALKRFKEANPEMGAGAKLLGRWHEAGMGKGFSLIEADDPLAMTRFAAAWADLAEQRIFPVLDDEEMAKALSG